MKYMAKSRTKEIFIRMCVMVFPFLKLKIVISVLYFLFLSVFIPLRFFIWLISAKGIIREIISGSVVGIDSPMIIVALIAGIATWVIDIVIESAKSIFLAGLL